MKKRREAREKAAARLCEGTRTFSCRLWETKCSEVKEGGCHVRCANEITMSSLRRRHRPGKGN